MTSRDLLFNIVVVVSSIIIVIWTAIFIYENWRDK